MMDNNKIVNIKNFNLQLFGNLLNQALSVTPQLMLEFNDSMLKSCSFSQTKSLIKLWVIPYKNLILQEKIVEEQENIIDLNDSPIITGLEKIVTDVLPEIPNFNFYILKGDLFKNYIGVFNNTEAVDLSFNLISVDNKYQASSIIIKGKSESGAIL